MSQQSLPRRICSTILNVLTFGQKGDPALFVAGDLEGFLFIFFNNFLNLSITYSLLVDICGFDALFVQQRVLPGTGVSVFLGSMFYWWQARRKAKQEQRDDVCALPFGISTPSLFAFVFFIVLPERNAGKDEAFSSVIFCCFWSGIIEGLTAFYGFLVRKYVPTSSLIASLSGISIALIATNTLYEIFAKPTLSMIPLLLFLFATSSRTEIKFSCKIPIIIPWGFIVLAVGTILGWLLYAIKSPEISFPGGSILAGFYYPYPSFVELIRGFQNGLKYAAVMVPLAVCINNSIANALQLINGIGSLQNLVSAKNKGDDFDTKSSLIVNGVSTAVASCFGCVFPTSIFIGHPTLKELGARSGYMLLNGIAVLIVTSFGLVQVVLKVLPMTACLPILVYVGFQMTAEGFYSDDEKEVPEVPRRHHLAVAVGVVPALANLTVQAATTALQIANTSLAKVFSQFAQGGFYLGGAIALSQGFLLSSMLLAAIVIFWIDRDFLKAAATLWFAALLSWIGVIHAYQVTDHGVENYFVGYGGNWMAAPGFVLAYASIGVFMIVLHLLQTFAGVWKQGNLSLLEGFWQWQYHHPQQQVDEESATTVPASTTEHDKLLAVNL